MDIQPEDIDELAMGYDALGNPVMFVRLKPPPGFVDIHITDNTKGKSC